MPLSLCTYYIHILEQFFIFLLAAPTHSSRLNSCITSSGKLFREVKSPSYSLLSPSVHKQRLLFLPYSYPSNIWRKRCRSLSNSCPTTPERLPIPRLFSHSFSLAHRTAICSDIRSLPSSSMQQGKLTMPPDQGRT